MQKILCPIDLSETAHNAVAYAAKFAKATGATLTLLHVESLEPRTSLLPVEIMQIKEALTLRLTEISNEVRQMFRVDCNAEVFNSRQNLSDTICAKKSEYDLILMGTDGIENLNDFFFGTNTYNVIKKSGLPVLFVPPSCLYSEIRKIVFAYDYLGKRTLPLSELHAWTKNYDCEITVLQVNEEAYSQDVEDEMKELQYILSQNAQAQNLTLNFDTIRTSEIPQSINSYMHRHESDLLVLCTEHLPVIQRLFHHSVIKVTSEIADYPVLIVHR